MSRAVAMKVVSADSHVLEPHDLWTTRLAGTPFADRAPHMVEDGKGGHFFAIDGLNPFPIGLAGAAGKPADELKIFGNKAEELRAGGWDPVVRLADMDTDGIAAEVLYPSVGMTLAQSKDLEYHEDRFDPMWAAFAERRMPVSFHILTGGVGGDPTLGSGIVFMTMMSVVHQIQQTLLLLILGGVFDRHPGLAVVSAEHDAGWVAHFAYRMDQMTERHQNWLGRGSVNARPPGEYLRENVWYTFQKDPVAVETRDRVGLDRLMWASDYPHSDSTWPHSRKVIERDFDGVPDGDVAAIVCDNAAKLYDVAL